MTQPVSFGVVEMALADHLSAKLAERSDTARVVNEVPHERPSRYVLVMRIGGGEANLVTDRPRIVAECCDPYGPAAAALADVVRALIKTAAPGWVGGMWIDKASISSVAYSPDPATNSPRYLVYAELLTRGAILT